LVPKGLGEFFKSLCFCEVEVFMNTCWDYQGHEANPKSAKARSMNWGASANWPLVGKLL
jgi:hypothetical protein